MCSVNFVTLWGGRRGVKGRGVKRKRRGVNKKGVHGGRFAYWQQIRALNVAYILSSWSYYPGKQSTSVHVYTNSGSVSKSLCSQKLSLPYLVVFSTTYIIFVVGRRAGGARASAMVVAAICSNPVQSLEVKQHDVILIVDCVSHLFLMSIDLEDLPIATVPQFRWIKALFIAGSTRAGVLYTCGCMAAKPLPAFSCKIQTNQVTYSDITMTFCTEDLEYIFVAGVPLIPSHVQPGTCTVNTASASGWAT